MSELAAILRSETACLHREAERSALIVALIQGRLARSAYVAMLRNLHALYEALERALTAGGTAPALADLVPPALMRAAAIADDLDALHGPSWSADIPLAAATSSHVERIRCLAATDPVLLAAPAYVRYLGDLNGGRVIAKAVCKALALEPGSPGVRFYDFGGAGSAATLAAAFRRMLNLILLGAGNTAQGAGESTLSDRLVAEARWSFQAHLRLFDELEVSASR